MTMHIYFNVDKDGHKAGESKYVERSLARRFCENGIAVPYQKHLDNVYDAEFATAEAEKAEQKAAKAQAKADEAEEKKKEEAKAADLVKNKDVQPETAVSKKSKNRKK